MNDQQPQPQPQPEHLTIFIATGHTCDDGRQHHTIGYITSTGSAPITAPNAIPDGTPITTCFHGFTVIADEEA